jgi:hypothetical protein
MAEHAPEIVDAVRDIVDRLQRPRAYAGDWAHDQAVRILNVINRVVPGTIPADETPPLCPRCGGPMFKVQDAPDSPEFAWGHDCEPD